MSEPFIFTVKADLNGSSPFIYDQNGFLMTGDNLANRIIVEVYQGQYKIIIDNTYDVFVSVEKSNGDTLTVSSSIIDGNIIIDLPDTMYDLSGEMIITIQLVKENQDPFIIVIDTHVKDTISENLIGLQNDVLSVDIADDDVSIGTLLPAELNFTIKSSYNPSNFHVYFENQNGNGVRELSFTSNENTITVNAPSNAYSVNGLFAYFVDINNKIIAVYGCVENINI